VEMSEAELIAELDRLEDPQVTVRRLFKRQGGIEGSIWFTDARVALLYERGFFEVPGFMDAEAAEALEEEALSDDRSGALAPASLSSTDVERSDRVRFLAAGEAEGSDAASSSSASASAVSPAGLGVRTALSALRRLQSEAAQVLTLAGRRELQLALYRPAETGYERHRDALPSDGGDDGGEYTGRRLTAIVYASDSATGAGALRLHLSPAQGGGNVVLEPRRGKAVVFMSGAVDHSVDPSTSVRVALTAWMH